MTAFQNSHFNITKTCSLIRKNDITKIELSEHQLRFTGLIILTADTYYKSL